MARGRNHNRNRNQQIQSTQQQQQQQQHHHQQAPSSKQQQQILQKQSFQQQHPQLSSHSQQQQQQQLLLSPQQPPPPPPPPPMQSTTETNAPVATINKHSNSNENDHSQNHHNGNTNDLGNLTPSTDSESYGHNNKSNNNYDNNNDDDDHDDDDDDGDDDANSPITVPLDGQEVAIKTHLETNGNPVNTFSTTHTYQMSMSNNSLTDFSQINLNDQQHSQLIQHHNDPSNSAREPGEQPTHHHHHEQREGELNSPTSLQQREEPAGETLSNGANCIEHLYINRSLVIEPNVSANAQVTDNNEDEELPQQRCINEHNGITDDNDGELNELTVCARDPKRVIITSQYNPTITTTTAITTMGQKNTKGGDASATPPTQSSVPPNIRPFRESSLTPSLNDNENGNGSKQKRDQSPSTSVPTITVSDCSGARITNYAASVTTTTTTSAGYGYAKNYDSTHNEKEKCCDFEPETQQQEFNDHNNETNKEHAYFNGRVEGQNSGGGGGSGASPKAQSPSTSPSHRSPSPTSMYSQMRYNYMKLEDVPEQEEEEYEDDDNDEGEGDGKEVAVDDDSDEGNETDEGPSAPQSPHQTQRTNVNTFGNLDNEFRRQHHSVSLSPDRQQRGKSNEINSNSNNSTESNLSTSFPDSGMGESIASTNSRFININDTDGSTGGSSSAMYHIKRQQREQFPFVRDGSSTDCDETLMQCEELIDFVETPEFLDPSERLVCIESISLPDVVVESTNSCGNPSTGSGGVAGNGNSASGVERDIININGATGNAMGNVHFIPIHVEGSGSGRSSPRKQSVDDSIVGSGKATIEIIEDVTEIQDINTAAKSSEVAEKLKKELAEQKTQFSVQLEDAHKNVNNLQTKINEMQMKIETLEKELSAKTWNVERLQGELNAAQRDDEYVRKKLKLLEDEKTSLRHRYSECEDELKIKFDELETRYNELQEKYKQTQTLASSLQDQLAKAQGEAEEWRSEVDKIRKELEEQTGLLKSALENSENERKICEDKWQREFEMLRTQNMDREESIMTDCEWQLRQTQKQCKERIDKAEFARKEAEDNVELLEGELEALSKEIDDLKVYQAQVNSLRGVVNDQAQSIQTLVSQIETLKEELATANSSLEEQIEAVTKIKFHCDNALYDKDRQMIYRIDEVRNEAAAFWEDKLYTEMTRLKNELESVYVDERREALDKLQIEHVEELKAITNRYTLNEEELRAELEEVQERLDRKSEEFLELREKSDSALLQTRMHLDRADREFQKAMCQEEDRREALEQTLRAEFEVEKQVMEEKFRERLGQVKEEFAKELQINTQELTEEHKNEMEKVRAKLVAEKEQALQELSERHRKKLLDAEERIKDMETRYKRDLKDLKDTYDAEKIALDKRDISNANEIEQLHRKCRCLTNLFEEMRMRYERRDPRPEDLREIAELRERCESQERDMYLLTDRLREMQIQMNELQQNGLNNKKAKQIKKPPPKTIPTNCDVIYEENEERESPPPTPNSFTTESTNGEDGDTNCTDDSKKQKIVADISKNKSKLINEQRDDSHMITAM